MQCLIKVRGCVLFNKYNPRNSASLEHKLIEKNHLITIPNALWILALRWG
jgi:hypothetical protein